MQPARLDLPIIQGATFRQILRIMQPELAYRPITAIASTSPVRLAVDHDLPTDWPVWVRGVTGFPALNKEFPRALPHLAQVVDAQHLDINSLAATGLLPKGGELSYYLPVELAGAVATLKVLDAAGAELLSVVPTVHAGGWVEVLLTDEETAALAWKEGAWYLDLAFPNGESYRAATGKATVYPVGTAPTSTCESAWVLTVGGQGAPGPMGPAFQVDAFGPLADRDQYDAEDEGFAFLATDNGLLYLREGAPGGWSDGVPFQGPPGEDGRSISSVAINGAGRLIITYSDGSTSDAGAVPVAPAAWGTIGGTLLDQDDLAAALAGKATAAQGAKADSAVQPGDLAPVATSGSYADLQDKPFIPSLPGDIGAATAAQGAKADTAVQPAALTTALADKVDKEAGKGLSQENFTSAEKAKLAGVATDATKNNNTDELTEGASNLYFTTARVLAAVLSGLSLATGGAIVSTDTVLQAFGKIQRQLNDHFGQGGSVHALATTLVAGFMSAADKSKLDGVAANATANDTDANLKSRANHTGTQAASTISDFSEAVDDRVAALLVAGSNITLTYNDGANTLTIAASGGGGTAGDMLATLVNAEVSVTASTTLTATAFGKLHVCSGTTADYTVGLPAVSGNAGKFIGFRMAPGLTKFVTLDANASELIDGATTRIMWANETAILYCDGSAWTKVAGRSIPLICGMYPTTSVTVLSATQTAVNLSGVIQDNSGGMAETASNRMRIKRPGTYRVNANCYYQAGSNTMNTIQCLVPKNGTATNVGSETIWQTIAAAEAFRVRYIDDVLGLVAGDTVSLTANQTGGTRSLYVNDPTWTYLKLSEVPSW